MLRSSDPAWTRSIVSSRCRPTLKDSGIRAVPDSLRISYRLEGSIRRTAALAFSTEQIELRLSNALPLIFVLASALPVAVSAQTTPSPSPSPSARPASQARPERPDSI